MRVIDKSLMAAFGEELGLSLTEGQLSQLDDYAQFLVEYNEKVNLTAIIEPREIVRKHFADSLSLLKLTEIPQGSSLIDVGTGAGFPSVPVKIARPDLRLTLLDSLNKRVVFLRLLCERLGIKAGALHTRAEEGGRKKELREQFDFATARAVAHLRELSEYCLPFVKRGGCFLALKGPDMQEELSESRKAIGLLGGRVEKVITYTLPESEEGRTLVVIRKEKNTPPIYPRPSAKMAKKPLG